MSINDRLYPEWAESGDTGTAPTDEKIKTGFVRGDKPTWQRMNYLFNELQSTINKSSHRDLINVTSSVQISSTISADELLYHPVFNEWTIATSSDLYTLTKEEAVGVVYNHASGTTVKGKAITQDYVCFGESGSGNIIYRNLDTVTNGKESTGVTNISCIESKYEDGGSDDFLVVGGDSGQVKFSTTGIGGTWTASTTLPSSGTVKDIVWLGGDNFMLTTGTAVWFSTDNCVNWGGELSSTNTKNILSYNSVDGRVVAGCDSTIEYSDDNGQTWTEATIVQDTPQAVSGKCYDVKYIGQRIWVAACDFNVGVRGSDEPIVISFDNGITWEPANTVVSGFTNREASSVDFGNGRYIATSYTSIPSNPGYIIKSLKV
jgi:hypothetical protein